jgi:predicted permease
VTFSSVINLQLLLFSLMLVGVYAAKRKLIDKSAQGYLTDLLLEIFLPCTIIASFDIDVSGQLLLSSLEVLGLSFAVQFFLLGLSRLLFRKTEHGKQVVLRYGIIVSNSAFLGLPVISMIMGPEAVIYGSIALIPLRIFMWTSGMSLFIESSFKDALKKLVAHPCIIAVYIGFAVLLLPFKLPGFLMKTVGLIGNGTTVISMFIIGSLLAEIKIKTLFSTVIAYFSLIRLVLIPLFIFAVLKLLGLNPIVIGVMVVFMAMPAGSTTAILAAKYGADSGFASKIVFVTTAFSLLTVPLFCLYLL